MRKQHAHRDLLAVGLVGEPHVDRLVQREPALLHQLHADHGRKRLGHAPQRRHRVQTPSVLPRRISVARCLADHRAVGQAHGHRHAQDALFSHLVIQESLQHRRHVGLRGRGRCGQGVAGRQYLQHTRHKFGIAGCRVERIHRPRYGDCLLWKVEDKAGVAAHRVAAVADGAEALPIRSLLQTQPVSGQDHAQRVIRRERHEGQHLVQRFAPLVKLAGQQGLQERRQVRGIGDQRLPACCAHNRRRGRFGSVHQPGAEVAIAVRVVAGDAGLLGRGKQRVLQAQRLEDAPAHLLAPRLPRRLLDDQAEQSIARIRVVLGLARREPRLLRRGIVEELLFLPHSAGVGDKLRPYRVHKVG